MTDFEGIYEKLLSAFGKHANVTMHNKEKSKNFYPLKIYNSCELLLQ